MAGIIFLKTRQMEALRDFYINEVGMSLWLDQGGCIILEHGNMLLGFCRKEEADLGGTITFFYDEPAEVDRMYYGTIKDRAEHEPKENPAYRIYHFFTRDPEGRSLEFQAFLHDLPGLQWNGLKVP